MYSENGSSQRRGNISRYPDFHSSRGGMSSKSSFSSMNSEQGGFQRPGYNSRYPNFQSFGGGKSKYQERSQGGRYPSRFSNPGHFQKPYSSDKSISNRSISNTKNQTLHSAPQYPPVVGRALSDYPFTNPGTSGQSQFSSYKIPHNTSNSGSDVDSTQPTFNNFRQFKDNFTHSNERFPLDTSANVNQVSAAPLYRKQPFQQTQTPRNVSKQDNYNQFQTNSSSFQPHEHGSTNHSAPAFDDATNAFLSQEDPSILEGEHSTNRLSQVQLTNEISTINKEVVDLKRYLDGTFRPGYKFALGLNVDNEESLHIDSPLCVNEIFPKPEDIERFIDNLPTNDELGVMLDKFVIFLGAKEDSKLDKDLFNVIWYSFYRSDRFGELNVEDSEMPPTHPDPQTKCTCVLRWKGVTIARSHGCDWLHARKMASLSLINALAHNCYTIQAKYSYYCGGKLPLFMLKNPEDPGVYKVVGHKDLTTAVTDVLKQLEEKGLKIHYSGLKGVDATHVNVVLNVINNYFANENNYCELIFGGKESDDQAYTTSEIETIKNHVKKYKYLEWRHISGFGRGRYIAVARKVCPQRLCAYLLSSCGKSVRYRLLPPQGPGVELMMPDCEYSPNIIKIIDCGQGSASQPANPVQTGSKGSKKGTYNKWAYSHYKGGAKWTKSKRKQKYNFSQK